MDRYFELSHDHSVQVTMSYPTIFYHKVKITTIEEKLETRLKTVNTLLEEKVYLRLELDNLKSKSEMYNQICSLRNNNDWLRHINSRQEKGARNGSYYRVYANQKDFLKTKISDLEREVDIKRSDPTSAEASKKISEHERKVANFEAKEEKFISVESENLDLKQKLFVFEKERSDFSNERKNLERNILELSKKLFYERKTFELLNFQNRLLILKRF